MDTPTPRSSASIISNTTELLENILSRLTTADLARLLPVCKKWHNIIISSPLLQETRFHHASARQEWIVYISERRNQSAWQIVDADYSTAQQLSLPPPSPWENIQTTSAVQAGPPRLYAVGQIHPALNCILTPTEAGVPIWKATTAQLEVLSSIKSLRHVFITNPPSKKLILKTSKGSAGTQYHRALGFTIGVMVHLAQKVARREVEILVQGTVGEDWKFVKAARKRVATGKGWKAEQDG